MGIHNSLTRPHNLIGSTANVQNGPELNEDQQRKAFGEDVGVLRCSWHMENADITSNKSFEDEVDVDLDMLGALMRNGVRGHVH